MKGTAWCFSIKNPSVSSVGQHGILAKAAWFVFNIYEKSQTYDIRLTTLLLTTRVTFLFCLPFKDLFRLVMFQIFLLVFIETFSPSVSLEISISSSLLMLKNVQMFKLHWTINLTLTGHYYILLFSAKKTW